MTYYTQSGNRIRSPAAYAATGAPMYRSMYDSRDINESTAIYKMNLQHGKTYIGKTTNVDRRMEQHFSGKGAAVTKKFKPLDYKVLEEVPGFFSDHVEQNYTDHYINRSGYNNVRGGCYTNSKTLTNHYDSSTTNTTWTPGIKVRERIKKLTGSK